MTTTTPGSYQRAMENPLNRELPIATLAYLEDKLPEETRSITDEQLATITNRIADIRGVRQSLSKKLSPILVPTPETTGGNTPRAINPTKLGQSLDEIIDQLGDELRELTELHKTVRL